MPPLFRTSRESVAWNQRFVSRQHGQKGFFVQFRRHRGSQFTPMTMPTKIPSCSELWVSMCVAVRAEFSRDCMMDVTIHLLPRG